MAEKMVPKAFADMLLQQNASMQATITMLQNTVNSL